MYVINKDWGGKPAFKIKYAATIARRRIVLIESWYGAILPLAKIILDIPILKDWTKLSMIKSTVNDKTYSGTSPSHNPRIHSPETKKGQLTKSISKNENFVDKLKINWYISQTGPKQK